MPEAAGPVDKLGDPLKSVVERVMLAKLENILENTNNPDTRCSLLRGVLSATAFHLLPSSTDRLEVLGTNAKRLYDTAGGALITECPGYFLFSFYQINYYILTPFS